MRPKLVDVTRALGVVQTIANCEASRVSGGKQLVGAGDNWSRAVDPFDPPALLVFATEAEGLAQLLSMYPPLADSLADAEEMVGVALSYAEKQLELQPDDAEPFIRYAWERAVRLLKRASDCGKGLETSTTTRYGPRHSSSARQSVLGTDRYDDGSDGDDDGPWGGRLKDRLN